MGKCDSSIWNNAGGVSALLVRWMDVPFHFGTSNFRVVVVLRQLRTRWLAELPRPIGFEYAKYEDVNLEHWVVSETALQW